MTSEKRDTAGVPFGDGWSKEDSATASCFCGAVQLEFSLSAPDLIGAFICHCSDDRKVTASMFASNFMVTNTSIKHLRGEDKLTHWAQSNTVATGNTMENSFCSTCGTLMYRRSSGYPGKSIMRIGTVDDHRLHATKLKPTIEQFAGNRVEWLMAGVGVEQKEGNFYTSGRISRSLDYDNAVPIFEDKKAVPVNPQIGVDSVES